MIFMLAIEQEYDELAYGDQDVPEYDDAGAGIPRSRW